MSINSTGIGGLTAADGAGTAFDSSGDPENPGDEGAATGLLHAARQVTAGAHSVYFSIFDQGDDSFDSAVFLDNLVVGFVPNPSVNCAPGANPVSFNLDLTPATATNPVGDEHTVTATVTDADGNPVNDADVTFSVAGANPGSGSDTTGENGQATFTYTGNNPGTDQIGACYDADGEAPCEAVGNATKTWTGLDVSSVLAPDTVTAGDDVLDTVTITATGGTQHDVTATVSAASFGGEAVSVSTSQGTCSPIAPADDEVSCTVGDLAGGASAEIRAVFTTPGTPPESGTLIVSTTGFSTEFPGGVTSTATAAAVEATPDQTSGFVEPGETLSLGPTEPTTANPTTGAITLPDTGEGAPITFSALTSPSGFCGGTACRGDIVDISAFEGYQDPLNPVSVLLRFDKSVVRRPLLAKLYTQEVPDGPITEIPYCGLRPGWTNFQKFLSKLLTYFGYGPHSGYAVPAPCINARMLEEDGDLIFEVLVLGADPKIGYR